MKVRPESATPERASYVTENRVRLELGLSEKDMLRLRRVQDLISQASRRPASLEDVLITLSNDYLKRNDPLERAKRQKVKNGLAVKGSEEDSENDSEKSLKKDSESPENNPSESVGMAVALPKLALPKAVMAKASPPTPAQPKGAKPRREPIPANLLHQVNLRDERRCTFKNSQDKRCNQSRWIEIHHQIPVSQGGVNTLENLIMLCSAHHQWVHSRGESKNQALAG